MMNKSIVLVVDDDININRLVSLYLEKEGYEVISATKGDMAIHEFKKNNPDIILLDVMLPVLDGWQVLSEIRKTSQVPIIMFTAKDETFDKVMGLELGADDYITKPFEPKELIARIKAVLRRTQSTEKEKIIQYSMLYISLKEYVVMYKNKVVEMPPKEIELLYFLAIHPNTVFTREQLLESVWGFEFFGDSRTVDVHIKRIREKLPDCEQFGWQIKTVWRVGYKFELKNMEG
ncbi:MAG: response regulator transcription factor [Christensenellaceae bacterium]|nr:response regulator transcription factor [Christensenellaceae bacterium]